VFSLLSDLVILIVPNKLARAENFGQGEYKSLLLGYSPMSEVALPGDSLSLVFFSILIAPKRVAKALKTAWRIVIHLLCFCAIVLSV